jgi:hypothetical protein
MTRELNCKTISQRIRKGGSRIDADTASGPLRAKRKELLQVAETQSRRYKAKGVMALCKEDMYNAYQTRWYRRLTLVLELGISVFLLHLHRPIKLQRTLFIKQNKYLI